MKCFSKDISELDYSIKISYSFIIMESISIIAEIIVVVSYTSINLLIPMLIFTYYIASINLYYLKTAREI